MEHKNEDLHCRFTTPEPLRMREVEAYERTRNEAQEAGATSVYSLNWASAQTLIQDWECKAIPDRASFDWDDLSGEALQAVIWAGSAVRMLVLEALFVPKNSSSRPGTAPRAARRRRKN